MEDADNRSRYLHQFFREWQNFGGCRAYGPWNCGSCLYPCYSLRLGRGNAFVADENGCRNRYIQQSQALCCRLLLRRKLL